MRIYNSTITEWSAESTLMASKFTQLFILLITRANKSAMPEGAPQGLLPPLVDISHTSLTALPMI
jgi:hypothetical protein